MQLYQGQDIGLTLDEQGLVWLNIGLSQRGLTCLTDSLLTELEQGVDVLEKANGIQGLVVFNSQSPFCVGADVKGFLAKFDWSADDLALWCRKVHQLFNRIEDLPFPSVSLVQGRVLGGGVELILATHYRIASADTQLALPEVKLGIFPGWGGTVRLPRLIGLDNALEWIATGSEFSAEQALKHGFLDAIVAVEQQEAAAVKLLERINAGDFDWRSRVQQKTSPLRLHPIESQLSLSVAQGQIRVKAGHNYPAPMAALTLIEQSIWQQRAAAEELEIASFVQQAKGSVAAALVSIFLQDTRLKSEARQAARQVPAVARIGVIGAGIMGAGIAQQAAVKQIGAVLNDLSLPALARARTTSEAQWLSRVEAGKMTSAAMVQALGQMQFSADLSQLAACNWVIEAVVERADIKAPLLAQVESRLAEDAFLATNTSTLSIGLLASSLQRPESFCGLHFFNPVSRMPLLEIVRGPKTSDACIEQALALAHQLAKVPIVVRDCPGFYVNRVLFPYFRAFLQLLTEGADYQQIDRVMSHYGWPMGPAWLLDVVGLDTAVHASQVLAESYPERMSRLPPEQDPILCLVNAGCLGQKSGLGFYQYPEKSEQKAPKSANPQLQQHLVSLFGQAEFSDTQIIERLMLPLWFEVVRCIDDGIVTDLAAVELGLVYGLGYPAFRGGPLQSMAQLGWQVVQQTAAGLSHLGAAYAVPKRVSTWAQQHWQPRVGATL